MTISFTIRKFFSIALAAVMLTVFCISLPVKEHDVKNADEVKAVFSVLSDCHIEGVDSEFTFQETYKVFAKILRDVRKVQGGNDAVVFLGDNTMNGQHIENSLFFGTINALRPAKEILVAAGNHDFSNGTGTYEEFSKRFLGYNNAFFTENLTVPYFCKVINGCYIVVLSSEDVTVNTMYLSDTQLAWLKEVLDEAAENKAPIFVMAHHPANYLEGRQATELTDILNDYDNLLYFCGHTHSEISAGSIYNIDGVNCVNLPRCTEWKTEGYNTGVGAQVEVYEDEIVVRIRDFYDSVWLDEYETSYSVVK